MRNHIQRLLEKLGAHNRLQALAIAFAPGLRSRSLAHVMHDRPSRAIHHRCLKSLSPGRYSVAP
ncbi:MAG: hypothetical protein AAB308_17920 [Nitrospirota bacterium]